MIVYKNVLQKLKNKGYNTSKLRKEKILSEGTIQRIREGKTITTETIDILCSLLDCQPGDILEYIPKDKEDL